MGTAGQHLGVCDPSEQWGDTWLAAKLTPEIYITQATWPRGHADGGLIAPALV